MSEAAPVKASGGWGAFEPLREPAFRTIWSSSLLSNFGQLILGVGAAWEMTRIAHSTSMVALVQTALMLPSMLVSVPAGAIADMFDRRKVALVGLSFACVCALINTVLAVMGVVSPWQLLGFCVLIGAGTSLYGPAWQASVREQVKPEHLPAAVALSSVSYNIARSFGPALGGVIILVAGARAAFAANALCYLPLILAFVLWKRPVTPSRLPPERLDRALVSGARYAIYSPPVRTVMIRALAAGMMGASISALTPIIARDVLKGGAGVYGLLLGLYGGGAVVGAVLISHVRHHLKPETAARLFTVLTGLMIVVIGFSRSLPITAVAMTIAGVTWMLLAAMLNLGVQLSAPRWVTARALSWYQAGITGGVAIGAWLWGRLAGHYGVGGSMIISGVGMMATVLLGLFLRMPEPAASEIEPVELAHEPEVALALTVRSGPIVVEIDYHVDPDKARQFYGVMLDLQRVRQRNGAFDWSLARNIADPALWTERYHCPTWGDYLRQRSRFTQSDLTVQAAANAYRTPDVERRVRRMLERPFGSVRWRADTPDQGEAVGVYAP